MLTPPACKVIRYAQLATEDDPAAKTAAKAMDIGVTHQRSGSGGGGRAQLPVLTRRSQPPDWRSRLAEALADIKHVLGIATFRIIVLQVGCEILSIRTRAAHCKYRSADLS